jgi:hypothetical protein
MGIRNFLVTTFTGRDNVSFDIGRILWAASFVLFCILEAHNVFFLHVAFDQAAFAQATGMILLGGGAAVGVKAHCEPDRRDQPPQ